MIAVRGAQTFTLLLHLSRFLPLQALLGEREPLASLALALIPCLPICLHEPVFARLVFYLVKYFACDFG